MMMRAMLRCYDALWVIGWMLMYQNDQECQLEESNGVVNGLNGMGWRNAQDLSTHAAIFIGGFCILYVYTMMMNANDNLNPSLQLIEVPIIIEATFVLNKIDESIELLHRIHSITVVYSALLFSAVLCESKSATGIWHEACSVPIQRNTALLIDLTCPLVCYLHCLAINAVITWQSLNSYWKKYFLFQNIPNWA